MAYELGVFIGRFQPFHLGHHTVVTEALKKVDRIIILIGSAYEPRSIRNPWSFEEREAMIRASFTTAESKRIICEPLLDVRYNDTLWTSEVQKTVYMYQADDTQIALIGQDVVEGEGYYTNLFPQWGHIDVAHALKMTGTEIRHHLFGDEKIHELQADLSAPVLDQLNKFITTPAGIDLKKEHAFVELYKKGWEAAPFAPTHVTVDAVVIQSGHVLLVKRGAQPGKGLFALPGGFIHHEETLLNAMIRKLKEETQIKVPVPALIGSIKGQVVFDAPFRSDRGRTITHAFHIELRDEEKLPKIRGGGETENCFWLPIGRLDSTKMFEDHYFIIQRILGLI